MVLIFTLNSFAAIVSDNDGAAFITKAEFDSLKNNFEAQIDQYNQSIDSKIDGAIAAYLSGISTTSTYTMEFIADGVFQCVDGLEYDVCYKWNKIDLRGKVYQAAIMGGNVSRTRITGLVNHTLENTGGYLEKILIDDINPDQHTAMLTGFYTQCTEKVVAIAENYSNNSGSLNADGGVSEVAVTRCSVLNVPDATTITDTNYANLTFSWQANAATTTRALQPKIKSLAIVNNGKSNSNYIIWEDIPYDRFSVSDDRYGWGNANAGALYGSTGNVTLQQVLDNFSIYEWGIYYTNHSISESTGTYTHKGTADSTINMKLDNVRTTAANSNIWPGAKWVPATIIDNWSCLLTDKFGTKYGARDDNGYCRTYSGIPLCTLPKGTEQVKFSLVQNNNEENQLECVLGFGPFSDDMSLDDGFLKFSLQQNGHTLQQDTKHGIMYGNKATLTLDFSDNPLESEQVLFLKFRKSDRNGGGSLVFDTESYIQYTVS